ncbi:unnamed protein product [Protopolystoma xenopodis]|uniref:Uncharacterized protein n=1 Tax=Protopolystoma xenopodis TaxID=117903 RepID=A0A3S5CQP2_9PLAT|nr:unnamed protein product [Protopolystoma xenopodis]
MVGCDDAATSLTAACTYPNAASVGETSLSCAPGAFGASIQANGRGRSLSCRRPGPDIPLAKFAAADAAIPRRSHRNSQRHTTKTAVAKVHFY